MNGSSLSYKIIIAVFVVYILASIQFIAGEIRFISYTGKMGYAEKLNYLDKQYYKKIYYKYFIWIDPLLPKGINVTVYPKSSSNSSGNLRFAHKFNYYLFPRYAILDIPESYSALIANNNYDMTPDYSDVVLVINNKNIRFSIKGNIKYLLLEGKKYYCVAENDDKSLLIRDTLIRKDVLKKEEWKKIRNAFTKKYDKAMKEVLF